MEQGQFVAKIGWVREGRQTEYFFLSGEHDGMRLVGVNRWNGVRFQSAAEAQRQAEATVAYIGSEWEQIAEQTGRPMPGEMVGMWDYAEFPRSA